MKKNFIENKIETFTYILEMIIAVLLAIGVTIGLVDLLKYFSEILYATPAETYDIFQAFLGYALVLIVGVELILMILHHSTRSILELVLFVIARKMLIYAQTMLDLVLGTLAIAIVFLILRFLVQKDGEDIVRRENISCSASTPMKEIVNKTDFEISGDQNLTVGSFVSDLAEKESRSIEEGSEFYTGDMKIKVTETTDDGKVKEVMLIDNKEKSRRKRKILKN